jgi:NTE family protein
MKKYAIGLTLSGGGAKGLVQAGVLQYMDEIGLKPNIISGSSVGSFIGALYASGKSPEDILNLFKKEKFYKTSRLALRKPGLIDTDKLEELFEKFFPENTFNELEIPVKIVATDILNGKITVFENGEIIKPLLASMAYPLMFTPVEIGDSLFLDGGIMNHFPLDLIVNECEFNIGVFLNPLKPIQKKDINSIKSIIERTFKLGRLTSSKEKLDACDILINPNDLINYNTFEIKPAKYDEIFDLGYQEAKSFADMFHSFLA